jgi:predicted nucleic acid-binding protein
VLLVADASALVGELTRMRGRRLVRHPSLDLVLTDTVWSEVQHELPRRLEAIHRRGRIPETSVEEVRQDILDIVARHMRIIPAPAYGHVESIARRRIPRDPNDWPIVALGLVLEADIWTNDHDFLGCGVATWTTETLLLHLDA